MEHGTDQSFRSLLESLLLTLVHANVVISVAATGVAVSTMVLAGFPIDPIPLFVVFAVTMFVYSLNRVTDLVEDETNVPGRAAFVHRFGKPLLALGVGLYALATFLAFLAQPRYAPAMGLPLLIAFLYSMARLKRVLLVKNLVVGLAWGCIPLGAGVYFDSLWHPDVLFMVGFVTVMLTIAAVVFDIKDVEGDREEGIRTVPRVLGIRRTRHLTAGATALVGISIATLLVTGHLQWRYVALLPFVGYVLGYSLLAPADGGPLYYGLVVDGEHILLALLLLAMEALSVT